ncbi:MAG: N-acetylmuramoyl-L-alanine amidase [Pseudorhodoplanes sp.]
MTGLFTLLPGGSDSARAQTFPVAKDVRVGGDDRQTRFVMDFTGKVDVRAFTLADPYRVVLDLPQVTFRLPPKAGESGRGLIKAFRFGLVMQGGSRIVLDVNKPVRIEKAFVLDANDTQPARLVLDLAAIDREAFLRNLALDNKTPPRIEPPRRDPLPARSSSDPRPIVVIDPGHGGIDNGTKAASGELEKTIVLDFALLLRDQLEKSGKYRVVMTRTDDTFVPLGERVRLARSRQAALFISIHADALRKGEGEAQGATVYTLSDTASDAEAARLAESENKADAIAGLNLSAEPNDVADILIDLAQRETRTFSTQFAHALVGEMKAAMRLHKHPMKSAGFVVLKAPDVPSVLVELGYVSNREDLKAMISSNWRSRAAEAIAIAVDRFFAPRFAGAAAGAN